MGIEPQTVKPALLVVALALWMGLALPFIDSHTSYQHAVVKGNIVKLADGITLLPTPGWDLTTGALVGHTRSVVGGTATTELVDGSVDFGVQAAPFAGTPSALLSRVNRISAKLHHDRGSGSGTHRYAVRTDQGVTGVGEDFLGVNKAGSVVAFVFNSPGQGRRSSPGRASREGVEIVVTGPQGPISRRRAEIVAMIRSIRTRP